MQNSAEINKARLAEVPQSDLELRGETGSSSFCVSHEELIAEVWKDIQIYEEIHGIKLQAYELVSTTPKAKRFFDNIVTKRYARILSEIRLRLKHSIGSLISFATSAFASITLLFGLSNSRISEILTAYFGASLSRIPTC